MASKITDDQVWDFVMRGDFPARDPATVYALKSEWRWGFAFGLAIGALAGVLAAILLA
jgi:hypothetical protein